MTAMAESLLGIYHDTIVGDDAKHPCCGRIAHDDAACSHCSPPETAQEDYEDTKPRFKRFGWKGRRD